MTIVRNTVLAAGAVGLLAVAPFLTPSTHHHGLLVDWMLYALLALSLNIVVGYLGELSFGHAAFFGVGAYTSALLALTPGISPWIGVFLAPVVAGLFGLGIGFAALRIAGPQFAILTLGFGSIMHTITNYWVDVTRGPMGLNDIPALSIFGYSLADKRSFYLFVLAVVVAAAYLCTALMASRTGRSFLAVRENVPLARSIGIDVFRVKLLGFVAATAMAGLAGSLWAHNLRVITPELMGLQYMSAMIIMVIVGGRGTVVGPIVGAFIYVALHDWLRAFGTLRLVVFAAMLVLSVVFLPNGLVSLARLVRGKGKAAPV
jgi:branched-chain amino acid transport system permease protein